MKRNLFVAGVYALTVFTLTSFLTIETPQDQPSSKNVKKHIVIEKIDEQGNKITLDTIIEDNNIFVWNGDTINGNSALKWIGKFDLNADSLFSEMNINFDVSDDGNEKVFIVKSRGDSIIKNTIHVNNDNVMAYHDALEWNDNQGNKTFLKPDVPHLNQLSNLNEVFISGKKDNSNSIDLSDPGIISYKKKKNKDGTEKITIVRKQVNNEAMKKVEEIILAPNNSHPKIFFNENPEQINRIKIIKDDGKETEIEIEENTENH